jgi:hypothetical protein
MQTKTYTTEVEAKKAAARAHSPAVVRSANGRHSCSQNRYLLPQGAHIVSRLGMNQWLVYK